MLKGEATEDRGMKTTKTTTRKSRIRSSLRYLWQDTNNASRAQFRVPPYDDYLQHERYTH